MADKVQRYFGDGSKFGLKIDYSVSPEEDETGRRLKRAASLLDQYFLLLYCDNYWPMQIAKMWAQFTDAKIPSMLTVYTNQEGYTRNNVRVDEEGYVVSYDRSRTEPDLNGVEISYALLTREILDLLPAGNVSFEATVYPALAQQRLLRAFMTEHRYYSVGSMERLADTQTFLTFPRAVFLDRDGVLNKKPPPAQYVRNWDEFEWLPGTLDALRLLKHEGYKVIVVTNQAGIARSLLTEEDLATLHERMQAELIRAGASLDAIYYCPHDWDEGCFCRKPQPGLLFQAQRDHHLDLTKTVFIGDDERDVQAGIAAGCYTLLVSPKFPLLSCVRKYLSLDGRSGREL